MLRRIFTSNAFIVGVAALFAFIAYNQDVDGNIALMNIILIIIVLVLSDIATLLKRIHQLLLLQSESVVDQAVASLREQEGEDPT